MSLAFWRQKRTHVQNYITTRSVFYSVPDQRGVPRSMHIYDCDGVADCIGYIRLEEVGVGSDDIEIHLNPASWSDVIDRMIEIEEMRNG